jgi:hypothetical protein
MIISGKMQEIYTVLGKYLNKKSRAATVRECHDTLAGSDVP